MEAGRPRTVFDKKASLPLSRGKKDSALARLVECFAPSYYLTASGVWYS